MDVNAKRRNLLRLAGLAPAAAAGLAAGTGTAAHARAAPVAPLTRSDFAACVGDEFVFETGALSERVLRLARVAPLDAAEPARRSEHRFCATFEVHGPGIPQETYRVSHPRLGRFALFVTPRGASGTRVEAIFNRL